MNSETKNCQNCKKDFKIDQEDSNFYQKINVPPPTWCPDCRQQRRYAWRNERTLYRRNCDLCGKGTVTIYSPNKPHKVYCHDCWWGDGWDFNSYGRDFDFSRPFFEQFRELQLEVPRMALLNKNSTNSEYTNHSGDNKNAYLAFSCFFNEDIMYGTWVFYSRDCVDCSFVYEKGERLYEVTDSRTSYESQYSALLKDSSSCLYCYDCRGCNHCFMSSNLRNKSYVFRNVQYTREEYLQKIKDLNLSSYETRQKLEKEFMGMLKNDSIHRYVLSERTVNSTGNLLYDTKNVHNSFEVDGGENVRFCYATTSIKDDMDLYHVGINSDLCYECQGCTRISNCHFCHLCYDNVGVDYSDTCQNSQNLFGCISVKKGEYMIFNKKYSKEDYLALKTRIIEHMKSTGEYGEFFPPAIAPVCYNETQGILYVPESKESILAKGWQWEDNTPGTFGKETVQSLDIPDAIEDVQDSYTKEVFACANCSKNYNVTPNELNFYRKEKVPFPRKCPPCRYQRRFDIRPARKLWAGVCKCEKAGYAHGEGKCSIEFKTIYAPDRPEKVYCEKCYQQEVY